MIAGRHALEELARNASLLITAEHAPADDDLNTRIPTATRTAILGTAGEWACLASWMYEVFVRSRPPLLRLTPHRYSRRLCTERGHSPFRVETERQGREPTSQYSSVTVRPAPRYVAERLCLEPGDDDVVCRTVLLFADGEPVQVDMTFIPAGLALESRPETDQELRSRDLDNRLDRLRDRLVRVREEVKARLPSRHEVAELRAPIGIPILEICQTSYDGTGRPFEVTRSIIRSDISALDYQMTIED